MAWNPSPKVADARAIGRKWGRSSVIIIAWGDEQIELATYGATKELCSEAKDLGEAAYEAVLKAYAGEPVKVCSESSLLNWAEHLLQEDDRRQKAKQP